MIRSRRRLTGGREQHIHRLIQISKQRVFTRVHSFIIKSRRLTFSGHLARMDENADAGQAIFAPPPENWRRPPGRPRTTWMKNIHDDLSSLDLGIHEARDLAQNRPVC